MNLIIIRFRQNCFQLKMQIEFINNFAYFNNESVIILIIN